MKLCVNIDHVASLREARGGVEPDPVSAAVLCELAGAHGITFHLRSDRRHIKERDAFLFPELIHVKLNMEMANTEEMVELAKKIMPNQITLVPEKRQELTTEGGLDVIKFENAIKKNVRELQNKNINVSLFINPVKEQIDAAVRTGARFIELHTGEYANAFSPCAKGRGAKGEKKIEAELGKLKKAAIYANKAGLRIYAGHGLNYINVRGMLDIPHLLELNIGHSIVSWSVFVGMGRAVKEMLRLMK